LRSSAVATSCSSCGSAKKSRQPISVARWPITTLSPSTG
jgi:hypothetical protein